MIYLYSLNCPDTKRPRYIGKTISPSGRFRQHIRESRVGKIKSHKCDWIRYLLKQDKNPIMKILCAVDNDQDWKKIECELVSTYKKSGFDLTNGTEGGDEPSVLSEYGRKILSERASAIFGTPEGRKRQSIIMKSLCENKDFVLRRDMASKAIKRTAQYKAKRSAISKKQWENPEYRKKVLETRKKNTSNPEFRKKLSDSLKKYYQKPGSIELASKIRKELWLDPKFREKTLSGMLKYHQKVEKP